MRYAIRTLEIEIAKIEDALRAEARYSVFPEYRPTETHFEEHLKELNTALDVLRAF